MSLNTNYSNRSSGYGRLTPEQSQSVQEKKTSVDRSQTSVSSHLGTINTQIKAEQQSQVKNINGIGSKIMNAVSDQKELKDLTPAQKKILSNVKSNINELKKEQEPLIKEAKVNQKALDDTARGLEKDIKKLEKLSGKVDLLKNDPKFGQGNFIFGTSKKERVAKAEQKAEIASQKADAAKVRITALKDKQAKTADRINEIQTRENILNHQLHYKLNLAKDVHKAIGNAKAEHDKLRSEYAKQKEGLADLKPSRKMNLEDKKEIKKQFSSLEAQIRSLETLEKKVGKEKIDSSKGSEVQQHLRTEIKSIETQISQISGNISHLITVVKNEKMNIGDRLSRQFFMSVKLDVRRNTHTVADTLNPGEIRMLQEMYHLPTGSQPQPPLSNAAESPPTDLPPLLPEALGGPPTDLPPPLPASTEVKAARPQRREVGAYESRFKAMHRNNPLIAEESP